jgi:hypothetical protein
LIRRLRYPPVALAIPLLAALVLLVSCDGSDSMEAQPGGEEIAFTAFRDGFGRTCFHECSPSGEIYVVGADGRRSSG